MTDTPAPVAEAVPAAAAAAEPAAVSSPAVEPAAAPAAEAAPVEPAAAAPEKVEAPKSEPSLLEAAEGKKPDAKTESAAEPPKVEAKEAPAPAEAAKPDAKTEKVEAKVEPKATDPAKEATATEPPAIKYEPFKVPDGVKLDDKKVEAFTGLLNDTALSPQDRAQKLVDLYTENVQAMANELRQEQRKVWNTLNDTWKTELRKDPALGGNRLETSLSMAKAVVEEFLGPNAKAPGMIPGSDAEIREFLAHTTNNGMGNYRGFVKLLHNLGVFANVFEDMSVPANPTAPKMPKTPGNRGWYPSMNGSQAP